MRGRKGTEVYGGGGLVGGGLSPIKGGGRCGVSRGASDWDADPPPKNVCMPSTGDLPWGSGPGPDDAQSLLGPPQSSVPSAQKWMEPAVGGCRGNMLLTGRPRSFLEGGLSSDSSWVLAWAPLRADLEPAASAGSREESWKGRRANARIIADYQLSANQLSSWPVRSDRRFRLRPPEEHREMLLTTNAWR